MRPRSLQRKALGHAAATLWPAGGGTVLQLSSLAGLELTAARRSVENMARAGELMPVRTVRSPLSGRRVVVYGPGHAVQQDNRSPLEAVLQQWRAPKTR